MSYCKFTTTPLVLEKTEKIPISILSILMDPMVIRVNYTWPANHVRVYLQVVCGNEKFQRSERYRICDRE